MYSVEKTFHIHGALIIFLYFHGVGSLLHSTCHGDTLILAGVGSGALYLFLFVYNSECLDGVLTIDLRLLSSSRNLSLSCIYSSLISKISPQVTPHIRSV